MLSHYRNLSNVTTITLTAVLELRGAFKNHPKSPICAPRPYERYAIIMRRYAKTDIPPKPRLISRGGWMAAYL